MGDYLIHYGVKGMKWGKRKSQRRGATRPGDGNSSGDGTGGVYKRDRNSYTAPPRSGPGSDSADFKSRGNISKDNHIRGVTGTLGYIDKVTGKPVWMNSGPASNLTTVNKNGRWQYQPINARTFKDRRRVAANDTKRPNAARYGNFQQQREDRLEKSVLSKFRFSKQTLQKVEDWLAKILGKK